MSWPHDPPIRSTKNPNRLRRGDRPFTCPLGASGPWNVGQKRCVKTHSGWKKVRFLAVSTQPFLLFFWGGCSWVKEQNWTLYDFIKWNCAYFLFLGGWVWGWECEKHAIYIHTRYTCICILYIYNYFDCFPLNWSPILRGGGKKESLECFFGCFVVDSRYWIVSRGPSPAVLSWQVSDGRMSDVMIILPMLAQV